MMKNDEETPYDERQSHDEETVTNKENTYEVSRVVWFSSASFPHSDAFLILYTIGKTNRDMCDLFREIARKI